MTDEILFVYGLILFVAVAMASNKIRYDVVALLVVLALMLSGILTVGEALAGFGSPVVILVAALLVVGEMLDRTGVARVMGDWIMKHGGGSEARLLVAIMIGAALLGAAMSSTAAWTLYSSRRACSERACRRAGAGCSADASSRRPTSST